MRRRDFLRQAAVLVPLAAACAPAPLSAPAPTVASRPTAAASGFQLPTYVAFQGPKADIAGAPNGLPPAYYAFPKDLVKSVAQPPGKGGDVTVLTFTNAPIPPGVDQNGAWQEINKQVGANLKINAAS